MLENRKYLINPWLLEYSILFFSTAGLSAVRLLHKSFVTTSEFTYRVLLNGIRVTG